PGSPLLGRRSGLPASFLVEATLAVAFQTTFKSFWQLCKVHRYWLSEYAIIPHERMKQQTAENVFLLVCRDV
ncbi:MAG: hypothetical protein ACRDIV_01080, partial [Ktedonobacteraceae bacterium]